MSINKKFWETLGVEPELRTDYSTPFPREKDEVWPVITFQQLEKLEELLRTKADSLLIRELRARIEYEFNIIKPHALYYTNSIIRLEALQSLVLKLIDSGLLTIQEMKEAVK